MLARIRYGDPDTVTGEGRRRVALRCRAASPRADSRRRDSTSPWAEPRANYLRLAAETVSRVLRRFQDDGLVQVDRRELEIRDMDRLQELAKAVLRG